MPQVVADELWATHFLHDCPLPLSERPRIRHREILCMVETPLRVYHLIARIEYGLMVQIVSGLITYLLLAIYCCEKHNEKVSIKTVRELQIKIQNETASPTTI